jgi:hypothetical protein
MFLLGLVDTLCCTGSEMVPANYEGRGSVGDCAEINAVLEARRGSVRGFESMGDRAVIGMRILISYDDEYRAFGEFMARTIRVCRPHLEVSVADDEDLLSEIARRVPELVICGRPEPATEASASAAWIELPSDPSRPSKTRVGTRRTESQNPSLSELLAVVDETERSVTSREEGGWPSR